MECLERQSVEFEEEAEKIGSKGALKTLIANTRLTTNRGGGHILSMVSFGLGSFVVWTL